MSPLANTTPRLCAFLVALASACSAPAKSEPAPHGAVGRPATPCAIPAGASAHIRGAVPSAGLTCTRYPWPLAAPRDVIEARDGTIYVTEMRAGRVVRLTNDGFVEVARGLAAPIGMREAADGRLDVAEEAAQRVTEIDPQTGAKTELAGSLGNVTYLTLGPDGALYVSSFTAFEPTGTIKRIAGSSPATVSDYATGLNVPEGLVFAGPDVVVGEWNAAPSRVLRFARGGGPAENAQVVATGFAHIYGVAESPSGGHFVADTARGSVVLARPGDGKTTGILDDIAAPAGMSVTASGDLLITELGDDVSGYLIRVSGFE